jgi:ATP-dependent Clp protease adaptor protein ClpS
MNDSLRQPHHACSPGPRGSDQPGVLSQPETDVVTRLAPRYNVVLLDDDDHSYEYVVEMLMRLFGHSVQKAFAMACEVDSAGRVIVLTTSLEHAELKRDQIRTYGPDPLVRHCKGSMMAVIEPVEC